MIDVHCHLVDNKFSVDIDLVIARAQEAGVIQAVVVTEFPSQFDRVLELKRKHPNFVIAGLGIHPIQKKDRSVRLKDVFPLESFLSQHQELIGCLGECGLDFTEHKKRTMDDEAQYIQIEVFREQIQLSFDFDLALNVHSRSAAAATISVLKEKGAKRVVLHAFDGTTKEAKEGVKAGYFFSIPPSFTINDSRRDLVDVVPLKHMLLETDSPVLGPVKGERNEPANCKVSAEFISKVKKVSLEEVIRITNDNARRLFKIRR